MCQTSNLILKQSFLGFIIPFNFFKTHLILSSCLSSKSHSQMTNQISRGAFIVFEGCDRAGKTTQCKKLVDYLNDNNIPAQFVNFPDRTTPTGHIIDDYLRKKIELSDQAAHLLFSANRWEREPMLSQLIEQGTTLICDRYSFSGVAFSSAKQGMNMSWCFEPEKGLPKPDAVFFLKLTEKAIQQRKGFGDERYEQTEFQKKVAENFEKLKDESWIDIDADKDIETVSSIIRDAVLTAIKKAQFTSLLKL